MKKTGIILAVSLSLAAGPLFGQQKPVATQYMFNGLILNPAYAGSLNYFSATTLFRKQWVNLEGAPEVKSVSAHTNIKGKNIGLGLMAIHDKVGVHADFALYGSYAYHLKLPVGTLSMGLQAGFNDLSSNFSNLNLVDPADGRLSGSYHKFKMNFGTGLYFYTQDFYAGLSVPYLIKARTLRDLEYVREFKESRYYYATVGKILDISHEVKLKPSVLMRFEDGMPIAFDLNCTVYLKELVNLGMSYREGDSFSTLFEVQLTDFIRFGYAYDWLLSDLSAYAAGSHELMVNYRINLYAPKKHRMCPGPYYF